MKSILYIEPAGNLWGSERSLATLINHMDTSIWKMKLCLPSGKPMPQLLKPSRVSIFDVLEDNLHRKSRLRRLFSYFRLYNIIRRERPDLIHLNQAGLGNIVSRLAIHFKIPLVIHVRLSEEAALTAKAFKRTRSFPFHCIAISEFVADKLKQAGVPPNYIHVITNPIELTQETPENSPPIPQAPKGAPVIGFVGRLTPEKGIECLLHSAKIVCKKRPDAQFWIIGGDGGNQSDQGISYEQHWQQLARANGLQNNLVFLGFRKDVRNLMEHFSLQVMASTAEPWGRVIAEAMSHGIPVIASDSGASREIIIHRENGLLFPPMDSAALAEAILGLIDAADERKRYSHAGQVWVKNHCATNKHSTQVSNLYLKLLGEQASRLNGLSNLS